MDSGRTYLQCPEHG